jgi:Lrp/AsnC family transcriptional regulator, leucine-responsive regulatory protein
MTKQLRAKDETDKKIIGQLFQNARNNFAEIAKQTGISKNAAWTRYKKLSKTGIITGATAQINYKKLGYDALGTLLMNVEPSQIEQVSNYFKTKIPNAFGPFITASRHNLRAVVTLKNVSELGNIKEELRKKLHLTEIDSSLWTDIWFTPENLSLIPIQPTEPQNKKTNNKSTFDADQIDLHIIRELSKDSRISFRTIAKQLDITVDTTARRYKKLTKEGVIVSRIQINPIKLGYSALVIFYVRIMPQNDVDDFIREIFTTPDVFYIMKCTGDFNVGVMLMVKDMQDVLRVGDVITRIGGTKIMETVVSEITEKWPLPQTYTSTFSRELVAT